MPAGNKEPKKPARAKASKDEPKKGGAALGDASSKKMTAAAAAKADATATLSKQQRKKVVKEEKMSKEERKKAIKEERAAAVVKTIEEAGYTAVVRAYEAVAVQKIIDQYIRGGLKVIEVATSCPQFAKTIKTVRMTRPEVTIGVGQCMTVSQCKSAIAAGAQFVVSPRFDEAVVKEAIKLHTPIMPGCSTPSEMKRAHDLGCTMQKLFPECEMPVVLQSVGRSAPACICEDPPEPEVIPEEVLEEEVKKPKVSKKKKKKKKFPDYSSGEEEE